MQQLFESLGATQRISALEQIDYRSRPQFFRPMNVAVIPSHRECQLVAVAGDAQSLA